MSDVDAHPKHYHGKYLALIVQATTYGHFLHSSAIGHLRRKFSTEMSDTACRSPENLRRSALCITDHLAHGRSTA